MGLQTAATWQNNFKKDHVDSGIFQGGSQDFVSAESIALCARIWISNAEETPPFSKQDSTILEDFAAIGLVQQVSISQSKAMQQLFEIGSNKPYFIPGRTVIQANVGRIVLNGDSLLKMFYPTAGEIEGAEGGGAQNNEDAIEMNKFGGDSPPGGTLTSDGEEGGGPLHRQFFINLASGFFNMPMDLLLYLMDSEKNPVGGVMLKQCYVQSHQLAITARDTVVAENVSIRCGELRPLSA